MSQSCQTKLNLTREVMIPLLKPQPLAEANNESHRYAKRPNRMVCTQQCGGKLADVALIVGGLFGAANIQKQVFQTSKLTLSMYVCLTLVLLLKR